MAAPLRFEIRHPTHREELSSESDFVVFGRDPSCDVVIKNPRCSRRHASIRSVPGGFNLLDLGSSNGVYVLGQKVDDAIIREGDIFSIGDVFIRILPGDGVSKVLPSSDATMVQVSRPVEVPRRTQVATPMARGLDDSVSPVATLPTVLLAGRVLSVSSILVGIGLVAGPLSLRSQLGLLATVLPALGGLSILAGAGQLGGMRWARNVHYALFTTWALTCLLAPLGVIGFAYQLRGEDHPETDTFFTVLIALAAVFAVGALLVAGFLARIYVPAPLPL
jgi:hypothetical protein